MAGTIESSELMLSRQPQQSYHEARVRQLEADLSRAINDKQQLEQALFEERARNSNAADGIMRIREILSPLWIALQHLYGAIDQSGIAGASPSQQKHSDLWNDWKSKLGGREAQAIDVLLKHGKMKKEALKIHLKCGNTSLYEVVAKLDRANLIDKDGAFVSLKEL